MRRHLLLLSMSLLLPHLASAQEDSESVQRARQLFGEGVDQHEHRRYREAVDTFRAVLAIRAAPAVRYNLALNLFELGQYPEADAQVQLILADSQTPPPLRDSAVELRTHMEERGGQLQIAVEEAPEGAEVQVDGYPVEDPSRPVRVIHGTHHVTLVHEEQEVGSEVVSVDVGETEAVTVSPSSGGGDVGDGAVVFDGQSFEGADPVSGDWRFWTALGVVAVVIVGIVIGTVLDDDDSAVTMPLLSWD